MNKKTLGVIGVVYIILFVLSFTVTRLVKEPSPSTDTLGVKTEISETSSTKDSSDEAIDSETKSENKSENKSETSDTQKALIKKLSEEGKEE